MDPRTEKSRLMEENPDHRQKRWKEDFRVDSSNQVSTKTRARPFKKHLIYQLRHIMTLDTFVELIADSVCAHARVCIYTCTRFRSHLYITKYVALDLVPSIDHTCRNENTLNFYSFM